MRFQPKLWATLFAVPAFLVLLGLGTWQVQRLAWKTDLIETRTQRIAGPALDIEALLSAVSPEEVEYRAVTLSGVLYNNHPFRVLNRVHNATQGAHVVVPMVLDGGHGTIMVDRGWIPRGPLADIPTGSAVAVTLDGFVRAYTSPNAFLPANEPDQNNWFHMNEAEMLAAAGLKNGVGLYVEAGPSTNASGREPVGAVPDVNLRNSHLQYAGTWYLLAAVLLVIFVIFHWRKEDS